MAERRQTDPEHRTAEGNFLLRGSRRDFLASSVSLAIYVLSGVTPARAARELAAAPATARALAHTEGEPDAAVARDISERLAAAGSEVELVPFASPGAMADALLWGQLLHDLRSALILLPLPMLEVMRAQGVFQRQLETLRPVAYLATHEPLLLRRTAATLVRQAATPFRHGMECELLQRHLESGGGGGPPVLEISGRYVLQNARAAVFDLAAYRIIDRRPWEAAGFEVLSATAAGAGADGPSHVLMVASE